MGGNPVLAGFGQIVRQQQQALGTQTFGFLSHLDGLTGRTTDASQNRHGLFASVDGGLDDFGVFTAGQGEEFTCTASSEQCGSAVRCQPLQAFDVTSAVEIALGIEVGYRKGQQTVGEDGLQFLWIHYSNTLGS